MDSIKKGASALGEKVKEGGEHISAAFKSDEHSTEDKMRAAEHKGKAEEKWNQAKESWNDSKNETKQDIAEAKGRAEVRSEAQRKY